MSAKSTTRRPGAKPRRLGILALVASMSLAFAGLVGLGLAPAASAAAPDQCTAPAVFDAESGLCVETTPSVVDMTTWSCPPPYTLVGEGPVTSTSKCAFTPEAKAVYVCPEGYSAPAPIGKDTDCTKAGTWQKHDNEWKCKTEPRQSTPSASTETILPEEHYEGEPCVKTEDSKFKAWICEDGELLAGTATGRHGGHRGERECGDNEQQKPTCNTVYVDPEPSYTYKCPTGFTPAVVFSDATEQILVRVGPDTKCQKTTPAFCPADQVLDGNNNCALPPADTPPPGPQGYTCEEVNTCLKPAPAVEAAAPVAASAASAATVALPAPAKAPAKKPVKVPAPGSVSAGVAGSASGVSAPTAATVPSAVPAGDGSQAPVLPVWALALIAVGVIGAAAAGKQLMGSEK